MREGKRAIHRRRPAETTTGLVAAIIAIANLAGVELDPVAVAAIVGAVPSIVSAIVDRARRRE